ncbi:MAG: hypothetical protein WC916_06540 [Candidatus Woesearchaeota archaeon]
MGDESFKDVDELIEESEESAGESEESISGSPTQKASESPITKNNSNQQNRNQSNHNQPNHRKEQLVAQGKLVKTTPEKTITPNIPQKKKHEHPVHHEAHPKHHFLIGLFEKHYKPLMLISMLLLIFSIGVIGYTYVKTGDIVDKGVTLKGGITLTVQLSEKVNPDDIQTYFREQFPKADISVRAFGRTEGFGGIIVESSGVEETQLISTLKTRFPNLKDTDYSTQIDGPSLGASFFSQTLKAVFIAFLFMSLVVFLYFGEGLKWKWIMTIVSLVIGFVMFYAHSIITYSIAIILLIIMMVQYYRISVPSFAIILCAFSDVLFSLAIFNLSGMKLNIGGVAAFLMLVGYSIDTDILMSVRVLKRREGTVFDRIMGSMKTGMMMSISALIAVLSAYFLSSSDIIREIMFILAVGLFADIIFTWIQNAGILRMHLDKKGWK